MSYQTMETKPTTIQLRHGVLLPPDIAWRYLFTHEFDSYYMNKTQLGSCEELDSTQSEDGSIISRKTKIIPVVGESESEKLFIKMVSALFQLKEISYVTSQVKQILPDPVTTLYRMEFENSDYHPDVAGLVTRGKIELQPIPTMPTRCLMITHIEVVVTNAVLKPFAGAFRNAAKEATDKVFKAMLALLPDYHESNQPFAELTSETPLSV